ncbi:phosphopantetheine-binding protein [Cohnella sp. 56]|uniref:phosphopantetheine-binding protein n=1 Tax=Cohnella sp. 56 TaxID=3113722 RepID=UPI0030EA8295
MEERQAVMQELRTILEESLELEVPDVLDESMRLYEDFGIDSIMVLQLMVYIEEVFRVNLPDEGVDPDHFLTLGSAIDLIESLRKATVQE